MTRDEIITTVSSLRFSSRDCFYSILDQYTYQPMPTGEVVKLKWPEALGILTLEQWNEAYGVAMDMCGDFRERNAQ